MNEERSEGTIWGEATCGFKKKNTNATGMFIWKKQTSDISKATVSLKTLTVCQEWIGGTETNLWREAQRS